MRTLHRSALIYNSSPVGAQHGRLRAVVKNTMADPVSVVIEEKVKASLQAEGGG